MGPIFETKDIVIGLALAPFCICLYPLACAVVGVHECVAKVTGKRWSDRHKRVPVGVAPRRPLTPPLPSECDIDQVEDKGDVNENNTTTTANNPESARRDATNNQSKQKQKQKRKRKRKLRRILKHKRKARAHTNPHPQANSILFRLPLELRMAIYSGVLTFPFRLRIGIRGLIGREGLQTDRNYYDRPNWRAGRNKGKYGWTVFGLLCCCRRV
ncbi:uncharacterized protein BDV14DRAFT_106022 [Aspergillus stella-maris]|uniref:uncharacterized protein n=1 Tax=Aspergillus stella-maris TaxID=1810926 RepID=UPI003CCDC3DE